MSLSVFAWSVIFGSRSILNPTKLEGARDINAAVPKRHRTDLAHYPHLYFQTRHLRLPRAESVLNEDRRECLEFKEVQDLEDERVLCVQEEGYISVEPGGECGRRRK